VRLAVLPVLPLLNSTTIILIERIGEQKFAVRVLTVLYQNSRDIPGRDNQLGMSMKEAGASGLKLPDRKKILKKAFRGVRFAATSTTTALGNVASEMLGRFVRALARGAALVLTRDVARCSSQTLRKRR
jgi:hypothetical protein